MPTQISLLDLGVQMNNALDLQVERRAVEESSSGQQDRSYLLRNRLHQASCETRAVRDLGCLHPCRGGCNALSVPWVGWWYSLYCFLTPLGQRKPAQDPLFQEAPEEKGLSLGHACVLKKASLGM